MDMQHETITFERTFPVSPARVFQAYASEKEREKWSAPNKETHFEILESDLRTGGREKAQCGTEGNMMTMVVAYHFVEQDRLIVFTEEQWCDDQVLTVALITFDLSEAKNGGTTLRLTDQVTSLVGNNVISGHRSGYGQALKNLEVLLVNG